VSKFKAFIKGKSYFKMNDSAIKDNYHPCDICDLKGCGWGHDKCREKKRHYVFKIDWKYYKKNALGGRIKPTKL